LTCFGGALSLYSLSLILFGHRVFLEEFCIVTRKGKEAKRKHISSKEEQDQAAIA